MKFLPQPIFSTQPARHHRVREAGLSPCHSAPRRRGAAPHAPCPPRRPRAPRLWPEPRWGQRQGAGGDPPGPACCAGSVPPVWLVCPAVRTHTSKKLPLVLFPRLWLKAPQVRSQNNSKGRGHVLHSNGGSHLPWQTPAFQSKAHWLQKWPKPPLKTDVWRIWRIKSGNDFLTKHQTNEE